MQSGRFCSWWNFPSAMVYSISKNANKLYLSTRCCNTREREKVTTLGDLEPEGLFHYQEDINSYIDSSGSFRLLGRHCTCDKPTAERIQTFHADNKPFHFEYLILPLTFNFHQNFPPIFSWGASIPKAFLSYIFAYPSCQVTKINSISWKWNCTKAQYLLSLKVIYLIEKEIVSPEKFRGNSQE